MPPKTNSKVNESCSTNYSWSLASEEITARYCQQNKTTCNKLYLSQTVLGTPSKNQNKNKIENELISEDLNLNESIIVDETLHTILRIHKEEETLLPHTKSKTIYWPWLAASRSVFLHTDIFSHCKIGNSLSEVKYNTN